MGGHTIFRRIAMEGHLVNSRMVGLGLETLLLGSLLSVGSGLNSSA